MNFICSRTEINATHFDLKKYEAVNGWSVYLDKGWIKTTDCFYKGLDASWCKIYTDPVIKIETNSLRDFPIYHNKDSLSNFVVLENVAPVDALVEINKDITIKYKQNFYPKISNKHITFQECHDLLFDALIENINTFILSNKAPVLLPAQGGIDTLTIRSVFDYIGADYKTFDLPIQQQKPSSLRAELIKNHWGFAQVEEQQGVVVVTGFYGDEWILRNPYYVHILLSQRDVSVTEAFDNKTHCYMKEYFEKYRQKCGKKVDTEVEQLISQLCNDFQIWHVNDTKYFSPLKHFSLINLLSADTETVIGQVTDATLSKSIIEKCNPHLINFLDKSKNCKDPDYFWHD